MGHPLMLLRYLTLLLLLAFPIADGVAKSEASRAPNPEYWVRIRHPQLPLSLELPNRTAIEQVRRFPLAPMLLRDGRRPVITLFGIRPAGSEPDGAHSAEIAVLWLTPAFEGVEPAWLAALSERIKDPAYVARGLRQALYRRIPKVILADAGDDFVDGRPARRLSVSRRLRVKPGYPVQIPGKIVVVPVRPDAALVIVAQFDRASGPAERADLLDRVAGSLELGAWGTPRDQRLSADAEDPAVPGPS